jgi:hypothetical protein
MKKSLIQRIIFILIVATLPFMQSCYKEPGPGKVKIIILDANKFRVVNATVKISQTGSFINESLVTDYKGEVEWENPLEVIMNVDVKKGALLGSGIIRVKPGESRTTVITIY